MKLTDFIVEDAIITELKATDKEAVIKEMVCALKDVQKINSKDVGKRYQISYETGGIG